MSNGKFVWKFHAIGDDITIRFFDSTKLVEEDRPFLTLRLPGSEWVRFCSELLGHIGNHYWDLRASRDKTP